MAQPPISFSPGERIADGGGRAQPFFTTKLNGLVSKAVADASYEPLDGPLSALAAEPAAVTVLTASGPISAPRVVRSLGDGTVAHADPSNISLAAATCGISQNAAGPGEAVNVRWLGEQNYDGWAWDLTLPIFCGPAGVVTQTPPTTGWCRTVGYPLTTTRMRVEFDPPILL